MSPELSIEPGRLLVVKGSLQVGADAVLSEGAHGEVDGVAHGGVQFRSEALQLFVGGNVDAHARALHANQHTAAYLQAPRRGLFWWRRWGPTSIEQLSGEARDLLRSTDWGYLDRRGALWIRRHDLIVNDTSIEPLMRHRPRPDGPIRGRVALGVALRLIHPKARESVRDLADVVGASPSTVHDALKRLREDALIDSEHQPLVPDLFNAVAAVWRPERIPVAREPGPGDRNLELGLHDDATGDVAEQGWVVSGDVAAAASGARIVVSSDAPPDFYVPTSTALRRALRQLGKVPYDERGATVALTPSPVVTAENHYVGSYRRPSLRWPIAHPVVIALDLAQDLARGREILADWNPQGFDRVW